MLLNKQAVSYKSRRWVWLSVTMICMFGLIVGGCGNQSSMKSKSYHNDGYMGYSNSNPNLLKRNSTQNYNTDNNFVEQVLKPIDGIEQSQIIINGSEMHVNLKVKKSLTDAEMEKLQLKAQSVVQYNMPRYNVHVETRK